jgi:hypothetical protein
VQQTSLPGRQEAGKLVIFVVEVVGGRKQAKVGWVEGKLARYFGGKAAPPTTLSQYFRPLRVPDLRVMSARCRLIGRRRHDV